MSVFPDPISHHSRISSFSTPYRRATGEEEAGPGSEVRHVLNCVGCIGCSTPHPLLDFPFLLSLLSSPCTCFFQSSFFFLLFFLLFLGGGEGRGVRLALTPPCPSSVVVSLAPVTSEVTTRPWCSLCYYYCFLPRTKRWLAISLDVVSSMECLLSWTIKLGLSKSFSRLLRVSQRTRMVLLSTSL